MQQFAAVVLRGRSLASAWRRAAGSGPPTRGDSVEHRACGVLEDPCHVGEEPRTLLAVDQSVVERQCKGRNVARLDLALVDPRLLADRPKAQDRRLARVDDCLLYTSPSPRD